MKPTIFEEVAAQRYSVMLDKALAEEPDLIAHLWNRL